MKPFDLQAALAGKPVVTRDGKKVTNIHHYPEALTWRLVGQVEGHAEIRLFMEDGRYLQRSKSDEDLFMAPTTETVFINAYPQGTRYFYSSEAQANMSASDDRIGGKAIRVDYEVEA